MDQQQREEPRDDGLVRRSFGISVRGIDLESRCVDVVASTEALDAHDEIVDQSWRLARYKANPTVLYNHNSSGLFSAPPPEYTLPIGYSRDCRVVNGQLEATLCFVDEKASPMAERVWQGFVQKSLRAVSVGFKPNTIRTEMVDGVEVYRLMDNELFEISVCPMGSNPEAVRKSITKEHLAFAAIAAANTKAASAAATQSIPAPVATTEKSIMNEEQLKALKAEHEKAIDAERMKLAEMKSALESKTAEHTKSLADLAKSSADLAASKASEDGLKKSLADANDKLTEKDVDALIGKKIVPAQKDAMLSLAKSDRKAFDALVEATPDLVVTQKTVPADPRPVSSGSTKTASDELAAMIDAMPAA